jgi:hypothetical protein
MSEENSACSTETYFDPTESNPGYYSSKYSSTYHYTTATKTSIMPLSDNNFIDSSTSLYNEYDGGYLLDDMNSSIIDNNNKN